MFVIQKTQGLLWKVYELVKYVYKNAIINVHIVFMYPNVLKPKVESVQGYVLKLMTSPIAFQVKTKAPEEAQEMANAKVGGWATGRVGTKKEAKITGRWLFFGAWKKCVTMSALSCLVL